MLIDEKKICEKCNDRQRGNGDIQCIITQSLTTRVCFMFEEGFGVKPKDFRQYIHTQFRKQNNRHPQPEGIGIEWGTKIVRNAHAERIC